MRVMGGGGSLGLILARGVRPGKVFVLRIKRGDGTVERVKLVASRR